MIKKTEAKPKDFQGGDAVTLPNGDTVILGKDARGKPLGNDLIFTVFFTRANGETGLKQQPFDKDAEYPIERGTP